LKTKAEASAGRIARITVVLVTLLTGATAAGETAYVSDTFTVPLRSGPSTANRILNRGLPTGMKLEVLQRDREAGYAQVRTPGGNEGWLPLQYLLSEPVARDQLKTANREIARLEKTVTQLRSRLAAVQQDKTQAESSNTGLQSELAGLEKELADIKQVSAGALETAAENNRLTELNGRLREELDDMVSEMDALRDDAQQRWLLIGGGLVLLGLVLGIGIKARPRRSAWS
jgi:SH3 domain protein